MRDLLLLLGIPTATVVGHSLGGGIALQFAYQYPQMCERLILVASGGFGAEVTPLLRAAALPGAGLAIAAAVRTPVRLPLLTAARVAGHLGLLDRHDVRGAGLMWDGLQDASTRNALLRTLRSVIDIRGQAVVGAGHLPHHCDPERFTAVVRRFVSSSPAAAHDARAWRDLLAAGGGS